MSRDEARKQLHGTFSFELDSGQVIVRDDALIREIHELMADASEHTQAATWTTPGAPARSVNYGVTA